MSNNTERRKLEFLVFIIVKIINSNVKLQESGWFSSLYVIINIRQCNEDIAVFQERPIGVSTAELVTWFPIERLRYIFLF